MKIQGKILDNTGKPLPYANVVLVQNNTTTTIGTTSNNLGDFYLDRPEIKADSDIQISHMGFITAIIKANMLQGTSVNMQLFIDELNEVVVTGTKKTKSSFMGGLWWLLPLAIGTYLYNKNQPKKVKI